MKHGVISCHSDNMLTTTKGLPHTTLSALQRSATFAIATNTIISVHCLHLLWLSSSFLTFCYIFWIEFKNYNNIEKEYVFEFMSCLHNLAPSYLSTMCQPVADNAGRRHLCLAVHGDLAVPATRTIQYGPRSFAVAAPSTWNSLPAPLRSCHLICTFRRDLKTKLFIRAYH